MKGVVFNIFEDFISKSFSEEDWELTLEKSGEDDGVFVGPKTYSDDRFFNLVTTAVTLKKLDLQPAIKAFGKFAYPLLIGKVEKVASGFKTPEEVLLNLDGIIHVEVKKLLENATPPKFTVTEEGDHLMMKYESKRGLCSFAEGLIESLASSYDVGVEYEQPVCTHKGGDHCMIKVKFIRE